MYPFRLSLYISFEFTAFTILSELTILNGLYSGFCPAAALFQSFKSRLQKEPYEQERLYCLLRSTEKDRIIRSSGKQKCRIAFDNPASFIVIMYYSCARTAFASSSSY